MHASMLQTTVKLSLLGFAQKDPTSCFEIKKCAELQACVATVTQAFSNFYLKKSHPVMSLCPYDACPSFVPKSLQALEACQLCIDELGLSSEISAEAFLEEREQRPILEIIFGNHRVSVYFFVLQFSVFLPGWMCSLPRLHSFLVWNDWFDTYTGVAVGLIECRSLGLIWP